jgi:hypothetical protein
LLKGFIEPPIESALSIASPKVSPATRQRQLDFRRSGSGDFQNSRVAMLLLACLQKFLVPFSFVEQILLATIDSANDSLSTIIPETKLQYINFEVNITRPIKDSFTICIWYDTVCLDKRIHRCFSVWRSRTLWRRRYEPSSKS